MVTLYITKWVLTRGIIIAQGSPRKLTPRQHRGLYEVHLSDHRRDLLTLGHDAFLSLEEAQNYAEIQFKKHLKECQESLEAAQEAWQLFRKGEMEVHQNPKNLRKVYAFGRPLLPRVDSEVEET